MRRAFVGDFVGKTPPAAKSRVKSRGEGGDHFRPSIVSSAIRVMKGYGMAIPPMSAYLGDLN
jgi:hypothetical protein